jgi:hypothetical protein
MGNILGDITPSTPSAPPPIASTATSASPSSSNEASGGQTANTSTNSSTGDTLAGQQARFGSLQQQQQQQFVSLASKKWILVLDCQNEQPLLVNHVLQLVITPKQIIEAMKNDSNTPLLLQRL